MHACMCARVCVREHAGVRACAHPIEYEPLDSPAPHLQVAHVWTWPCIHAATCFTLPAHSAEEPGLLSFGRSASAILSSPVHTKPYHSAPYHAIPHCTMPYRSAPWLNAPYHTVTLHTVPYHTIEQLLRCWHAGIFLQAPEPVCPR